jgi:alkyl hydroperoxide reductase subunit AhpC
LQIDKNKGGINGVKYPVIAEAIRTLDALRHFEENGEVCLANGQERSKAMTSSFKGVATYLSDN